MQQKSLIKYKIGFTVVVLFVIVLLILVITQAKATKEDSNTYNSAFSISDTLNQYINVNNTIPNSLKDAGVLSVPSTITYQKLSDSSFKFCINYKTTSSGFDATSTITNLLTSSSSSNQVSSTDSSYLFIDPTHHKGNNCQTIKPSYLIPTTIYNNTNSSSQI